MADIVLIFFACLFGATINSCAKLRQNWRQRGWEHWTTLHGMAPESQENTFTLSFGEQNQHCLHM